MSIGISRDITVSVAWNQHIQSETIPLDPKRSPEEQILDHNFKERKLHPQTFCKTVRYQISKTGDKAFLKRKLVSHNPKGNHKNQITYLLRDGKLYPKEEFIEKYFAEWIKAFVMTFYLPIATGLTKIAFPILYLALKALSLIASLFTCFKENCFSKGIGSLAAQLEEGNHCKRAFQKGTPLKALIGIIVHPILALLALIPGLSHYFNKFNGDLENWINGYSFKDLTQKSLGEQQKESTVLIPCQHPVGAITASTNAKEITLQGPLFSDHLKTVFLRNAVRDTPLASSHPRLKEI